MNYSNIPEGVEFITFELVFSRCTKLEPNIYSNLTFTGCSFIIHLVPEAIHLPKELKTNGLGLVATVN